MKLQPFRAETLADPTALRLRLNEMVRALNETATRVQHRRIPSVQSGMTINIASPEFTVGAVLVGGVSSTSGGAVPTAAPWADWVQQGDGSLRISIGGLAAAPSQYAVNLVLVEAGGVV